MFSLREFVKGGLLKEDDLAEIQNAIEAQYNDPDAEAEGEVE